MPSAGSWNATRRPDPLTAGQKLLLPLALPLGPSLPPPSPSSSQPAVFSSDLTSGGNIQNLCLCACTCIIVESRYSNPLLSKLYLDDTGSMLPVRLRGREGKSSMDAVFGVIIEYGIERGGRGLGGGSWFSNIWR